jgi:hypothetical protein
MELKDIVGWFLVILIPLIAFAYKAPKAYNAVLRDFVKYVSWGWWLVVFVTMTFWFIDKLELIKVSFFSDDFRKFLDDIPGPDLLPLVLIPPLFVWCFGRWLGKVSKYREYER